MAKEYIERGALIDEVESTQWYHISHQKNLVQGAACEADALYKATDIYSVIKSAPTADVVEVVRCEKCTHKVDFRGRVMCNRNAHRVCDEWYGLTATDNDHFCSYGLRKDE